MFTFMRAKKARQNRGEHARFSTLLPLQPAGQPIWSDGHFDNLSLCYQKNVIVYRCVSLIARSVSSVPLTLFEGDFPVEHHPLLTLLKRPNPLQGHNTFFEALISYLLLSGNSYIEAVFPANETTPAELYALRPDRVHVVPGNGGFPMAYEYVVGSARRRILIDPLTGNSPILHLRLFHPLDDWHGLSPLEAARQSTDLHNTVVQHNISILQNGGRPSGALVVKSQYGLTEAQRQQLRSDLSRIYSGDQNAGKIMVLEGEFEWKEMGLSPKDLDFIEGKNLSAREISQAFGVPPMLVGILGDATFSNYREARLHLWEDTVLPLLESILNQLNTWMTALYGKNLILTYDPDAIPALAPKREAVWERIGKADFLTINEKRKAVGYAPVEGGDTLVTGENQ